MKNQLVQEKMRKTICKYFILFLIFGSSYFLIECLWRGHLADWRMAVMGGVLAIFIGLTNHLFSRDTGFLLQCILGALMVTLSEAIWGTHWKNKSIYVWDYTTLPCSYINGTINLFFSFGWCFLSALCIVLDDTIRWLFFHEQKPYYKLR